MRLKSIHKIVSFLLVLTMALMVINKTVYVHTHKLADGTIVTHAHPFNKSSDTAPVKEHHHTSFEFLLLNNLGLLFLSVSALVLIFLNYLHAVVGWQHIVSKSFYLARDYGRGPPLF